MTTSNPVRTLIKQSRHIVPLKDGQWLLINQKLTSLISPGGNNIPPDKAAALRDGAQIRLSREPHGRMAEVKLLKV